MFRTLLFVVCAVRANFWDIDGTTRNGHTGWLESLKKRLMTDNYDYEPSSGEFELRALNKRPLVTPTDTTGTNKPTDALLDAPYYKIPLGKQIEFIYDTAKKRIDQNVGTFDGLTNIQSKYMFHHQSDDVFTTSVPQNSIDERDDVYGISRNDLHMHIRDSMMQALEDPGDVAPKNVSYKVIQPSLLSRRVGRPAPRFVEEVGANGVSLLSVDGAPFPEFHLPSARRQYQAVKDSFSEDWLD